MNTIKIAFIGGSGLYKVDGLSDIKWVKVKSSYGLPSSEVCVGNINGNKVAFLPRHGKNHNISPSKVNYRANIEILKKLNVENIISLSAVGSLRKDFKPGDFVVVDQFIDRTTKRENTFFEDDLVIHIPFKDPVCKELSQEVFQKLKKLKIRTHQFGTYICIEGPQFSSLAESQLYRSWGCDVIGMTNLPEARLSMEAGICYASVAMVTDFDCWHPDHDNVSVDQIINTLKKNTNKANSLINEITKGKILNCSEKIKEVSRKSMISDLSNVKQSTKKKLKYILNL